MLWIRIQLIPDEERLWRALHQRDQVYANGEIKPAFFRDIHGLSCDLARFSTPERSRRGYGQQAFPQGAGLVEFRARHVRAAGSDVRHEPKKEPPPNYAHSQFTVCLERAGQDLLKREAQFRIAQGVRL
jgi:hypothetical protein